MCNLSVGIKKQGIEKGLQLAMKETEERAKDMLRDHMELSLVEKYTRLPLERIKELARGIGQGAHA